MKAKILEALDSTPKITFHTRAAFETERLIQYTPPSQKALLQEIAGRNAVCGARVNIERGTPVKSRDAKVETGPLYRLPTKQQIGKSILHNRQQTSEKTFTS